MTNDEISKRPAGSFYVVQTDDAGSRRVAEGCTSAIAAARYIAGVTSWVDADAFAVTWIAMEPDGGERFEIGQE